MKRIIAFMSAYALVFSAAVAAVRGTDVVLRTQTDTTSARTTTRTTAARTKQTRNILSRPTESRTRSPNVTARTATGIRGAITSREFGMRPTRTSTNRESSRSAITPTSATATATFDTNYQECYDAYFSCMDQFCALQNDKYRRCVCSSKLDDIQKRERALNDTSDQLQDFKNLNIEAILKTPAEVKAMLSASEGELKLAKVRDNSSSAQKLNAISDVLTSTRINAVSTAGQLDIGGDIKQIWNTTDLISGSSIANLTGESLYNAVHAQCRELVSPRCPSTSTLNLVASAYGMYIENDCTIIMSSLNKQAINANTSIRQTNHEMTAARLENYNAHNSATINECIAGVREALTADSACGENYVHCLDLTGLYLNRVTGDPIYSANFYKLNDQISLTGDILTNNKNAKIVTELNSKKEFAKQTLETCRDIADSVWDEFLRQAITEIYQGQQEKIRIVKDQCMDVVNTCYDTKANQLRDFSNIQEQFLLGTRLELSEEMCKEKLNTCSNLYGGGPNGLALLVTEMQNITNQKIAQNCLSSLREYATKLCRASSLDVNVSYPYGCRVYAPGNILYASNPNCAGISNLPPFGDANYQEVDPTGTYANLLAPTSTSSTPPEQYACPTNRIYSRCFGPNSSINDPNNPLFHGFFLYNNKCYICPDGWTCDGSNHLRYGDCGEDYAGSLYQKMVQYALQYCVRPSEYNNTYNKEIPNEVLADVNSIMDSIRIDMATVLASECDRMGGVWTTTYDTTQAETQKFTTFYNETNANLGWGLCYTPTP